MCRRNQIEGQMNLKDAVRRNISFKDPKSGKTYQLKQKVCSPYRRLHCFRTTYFIAWQVSVSLS
jgi:malate synthase